jgi:porphobilinogen synthase
MQYPQTRLRRLRSAPWVREMLADVRLHKADLIQPLFVHAFPSNTPISALPGQYRFSINGLAEEVKALHQLGCQAIALFPVIPDALKDAHGSEALNPENLACTAIQAIKQAVPAIGVIADVALDPYTSHGHDGVLNKAGDVGNDITVALLSQQALLLAQAGADIVAPSDMMDGRIGAIRHALEAAGLHNTLILSYAVKYASTLYAPFRDAVGSQENFKGDKLTYQLPPASGQGLALREAMQDIQEGADMLMVKPATLYLDVLARLKDALDIPLFAYHVSGEYAMLKQSGMPFLPALQESLLAIKRAGATAIVCYGTKEILASMQTTG